VRQVRERLAAGRNEIARQRRPLDTRDHIDEMSRWTEETERQLRQQRDRRNGEGA
jgi:hypothetical protein